MCGGGSALESGRTKRVGVCVGGGRDAEGRLQASLMVLVGENRCGRGVNNGRWVVRDVGEDFNVSVAGGRVWGRRGEECSRIGSM